MLKIKDNVDLKELEKFGFIFMEISGLYFKKKRLNDDEDNKVCYSINTDDRKVYYYQSGYEVCMEATLYDLIKADLVEKVEE